ncbi:hypothetical protein Poli38472_004325 [Pythium oligandrum]|uniref:RanBP2-type domain-containing protein n=1 Tax=Pythium oligandrum TaxID=41045 RepID=A0A8K1C9P4_PYTOL|nr:hypothetical protein Poli38472_004325 [Pythium oligandrum]|eukprot:TMW59256.1 hypothetical protein Poli38472_004325 [Pythium oligandrum]
MEELWDSEVARAGSWLRSRRRQRAELQTSIFERINNHVLYLDHQRGFQENHDGDGENGSDSGGDSGSDKTAEQEELTLDFLGEIDPDDMRTLLDANTSDETVVPPESAPVTLASMEPLQMPLHLISEVNPSHARAREALRQSATPAPSPPPIVTTNPTAFSRISVGVSLGEDDSVSELMDTLQIDASTLHQSKEDGEESKTEESTPPLHVRLQQAGFKQATSNGSEDMPPKQPAKTKEAALDPNSVAAEMFSWVDGERHPDVIKRKESLRQRRQQPTLFGSNTYSDKSLKRHAAKLFARESDGSSDDLSPNDSDFSAGEVDGEDEPEEPCSDTELLPDDYLDESRMPQKARRRIRQRKEPKQKRRRKSSQAVIPVSSRHNSPQQHRKRRRSLHESDGEGDGGTSTGQVRPPPPKPATPAPSVTIDLRSEDEDSDYNPALSDRDETETRNNSLVRRFELSKPSVGISKRVEQAKAKDHEKSAAVIESEGVDQSGSIDVDMTSDHDVGGYELGDQGDRDGCQVATTTAGLHEADSIPPNALESDVSANPCSVPEKEDGGEISDTGTADFEMEASDDSADEGQKHPHETDLPRVNASSPPLSQGPEEGARQSRTDGEVSPPAKVVHESRTMQPMDPTLKTSPQRGSLSSPVLEDKSATSPQQSQSNVDAEEDEEVNAVPDGEDDVSETDTVVFDDLSEVDSESSDQEEGTSAQPAESITEPQEASSNISAEPAESIVEAPVESSKADSEDEAFGQFFSSAKPGTKEVVAAKQTITLAPFGTVVVKESVIADTVTAPEKTSTAAEKTTDETPEVAASPGKTATGSNGLRKVPRKVPPVNTMTVTKGKYSYKRAAIRMLDENGDVMADESQHPKHKLTARSRLLHHEPPLVGPSLLETHAISPLQLRKTLAASDREDRLNSTTPEQQDKKRYLGYQSTAKPATTASLVTRPNGLRQSKAELFARYAKNARSKYDKTGGLETPLEASRSLETTGAFLSETTALSGGMLQPKDTQMMTPTTNKTSLYMPPRERQLNIYQVTGAISQVESPSNTALGLGSHKRPTTYVKQVDEAKRNGTHVKKGLAPELDPRAPIPKKAKTSHEQAKPNGKPVSQAPSVSDEQQTQFKNKKKKRGKCKDFEDGFISESDDGEIELIDDEDDWKRRDIRYPLRDVPIDHSLMERMIYLTHLPIKFDEVMLEEVMYGRGVATDPETGFAAIHVFMNPLSQIPRGDARVVFESSEAAAHAVQEINGKTHLGVRLVARPMDTNTMRILHAHFDIHRDTWECANDRCRRQVSVWTARCDGCGRRRVFSIRKQVEKADWLCSICFSTNDQHASKCFGCNVAVPDQPRHHR